MELITHGNYVVLYYFKAHKKFGNHYSKKPTAAFTNAAYAEL